MNHIFKKLSISFLFGWATLVSVDVKAQADAAINGIDPSNRLSSWTAYFSDTVSFAGNLMNTGTDTINSLTVTVEVFDNTATLIYTDSAIYNTIAPAASLNYNAGQFFTKVIGAYSVKGFVTVDGLPDANASNDTAFASFAVTDSTMARDYSMFTGVDDNYTINSANPDAKMGNLFTVPKDKYLTSVRFILQNPANAGDTVRASIYGVDSLGLPDTSLIAQTIIYTITAADVTNGADLVLPIENNLVLLTAGTYMVAVNEYQGNINLATTNRVYTPLTSFYLWPPLSLSQWIQIEWDFVYQTYVIEPNFGCVLSVSGTITDEICDRQNGSITADVTFNSGIVSYLWSTGDTDQTISNLAGGLYTVTVTDEAGCSLITALGVGNIAGPGFDSTGTTPTNCFGSSDGSAIVYASGGTGSIGYQWSNGETTSSISNLAANTYTVIISDQNACVDSVELIVAEPTQVSVSPASTGTSCFGGADGSVNAVGSGGTGTFTYLWSTGDTDASVPNLSAGTYTVTATDSNGCSASQPVDVTEPSQLVITPSVTDASCFGDSSGSAIANVTGGTGAISYLWTNGETTSSISNQYAGIYNVSVSDQNLCSTSLDITINEPAQIVITTGATSTLCFGGNDGTANASVVGGTGAYSYLWSSGDTADTVLNLMPGTYTVTVTDANSCTASSQADVLQPAPIDISPLLITDADCYGSSTGSAIVSVTGGVGALSYLWSVGDTNSFINNQLQGTYTVTVTDQNNCSSTLSLVIGSPTQIIISTSFTNTSCFGGNDGTVSASASGGSPGYTYLWSTGDTDLTVSNLSVGTYTVTVTDTINCTASITVDVDQPSPISISPVVTNISCNGNVDGSIMANTLGGVGAISYVWSNGATTIQASNLAAGTYTVTATDQNGCTGTNTATVIEPGAVIVFTNAIDEKCFGGLDGSVFAIASGGTGNLTYLWSNGATTSSATGVGAGTYTVQVADANNCTGSATAVVTQPATPIQTTTTSTADNGSSNGTATVSTTVGGIPPYTYSWNTVPVQTNTTATGLAAGTYIVAITDSNLCVIYDTIVVQSSIGIHEQSGFEEFLIAPNPAHDNIFISLKLMQQSDVKIQISDVTGKVVFENILKNVSVMNKKISVEAFSKGVYSVTVQTQSGQEIKRIVVE